MNDDLIKPEQLSALVDGEAAAIHVQAALSFAESDEGQQSWAMYHLIGDVLRSPELAHHCQHDILSGVRAQMAREPVAGIHLPNVRSDLLKSGDLEQIDSPAAGVSANTSVFRWKMAAGFASVAAVAAVGWGVMLAGAGGLNIRQGGALLAASRPDVIASSASFGLSQPDVPDVSVADEAQPLGTEAQASTLVAVASANGQTVMLRDPRLDELLASHPQQSSVPNLQMPAGFLRNSSFAMAKRQ